MHWAPILARAGLAGMGTVAILNAAQFYEVTQQVVLTSHMIQSVFIDIAKPVWDKLSPAQQATV